MTILSTLNCLFSAKTNGFSKDFLWLHMNKNNRYFLWQMEMWSNFKQTLRIFDNLPTWNIRHTLLSYLREKKHFSFHLKSEFVLFVVFECPHFVDHIFQVGFDKVDCRLKSLSNSLLRPLRPLVVVVTEKYLIVL